MHKSDIPSAYADAIRNRREACAGQVVVARAKHSHEMHSICLELWVCICSHNFVLDHNWCCAHACGGALLVGTSARAHERLLLALK